VSFGTGSFSGGFFPESLAFCGIPVFLCPCKFNSIVVSCYKSLTDKFAKNHPFLKNMKLSRQMFLATNI
jgi:hypothetical protein